MNMHVYNVVGLLMFIVLILAFLHYIQHL